MTDYLFDTPKVQSIPVKGEAAEYPVHRIFCVGRNYAAHAAEMGVEVDREAPFYFTKNPHAVLASGAVVAGAKSGRVLVWNRGAGASTSLGAISTAPAT